VTPLSAPEHHRTDRRMKPRFALFSALIGLAFGLLAGPVAGQRPNTVGIRPGEQCPAGMTEIRPLQCMAPQLEAPSILAYRPRSTLVVPEHPIPRPKYPAIDFHGHPRLDGPESLAELEAAMDRIGLGVMIVASNVRGERLREMLALIQAPPTIWIPVRFFTATRFGNSGPGRARPDDPREQRGGRASAPDARTEPGLAHDAGSRARLHRHRVRQSGARLGRAGRRTDRGGRRGRRSRDRGDLQVAGPLDPQVGR